MKPAAVGTILVLLAGCTSAERPAPNIVVSNVNNESEGLPHATKFCAQHGRIAIFKTRLRESFQFDCVKRQ